MRWPQNLATEAARRREERLGSKGAELERKYPIALAMFVVLAVVAWFTVGDGDVMHGGLAQGIHAQMFQIDSGGVAGPEDDAAVRVGEIASGQDQSLFGQFLWVLHIRR